MQNLQDFFNSVANITKFSCTLGKTGGFINFRNSGQRGSVKEFTLSLESLLSGLKDIRDNRSAFQAMTDYNEKEWRDNGSEYFTDLNLNSMITVQTKPCFTTFSKIINWANDKEFTSYDDNKIDLSEKALNITIEKLTELQKSFTPKPQPKTYHHNSGLIPALPLPKPFLLLAGISGTGKTRFVREQAKTTGQFNKTYCLTSVRPDWQEPSDLLGYVSRLNKDAAEYVTTDVLQFIAKAWRGIADSGLTIEVQDTEEYGKRLIVSGEKAELEQVLPYWLCLDEMNLAPVEQYFADYLSVLETREWSWEGDSFAYSCDALLKPATIREVADNHKLRQELGFENTDSADYDELWALFCQYGLGIPFNLIVAGTVNMDETTHGFSRKVIDRALSFDFGAFFPNIFDEFFVPENCNKRLSYPLLSQAKQDDLSGSYDTDGNKSKDFLSAVNSVLKNTPFELAFRALNELLLSVACTQPKDELTLKAVWDDFLMCKVLPRIEGDADKLSTAAGNNLLKELSNVLELQLNSIWRSDENDEAKELRPDLYREKIAADGAAEADKIIKIPCRSKAKLAWMQGRLDSATFTSFWP